MDPTRRELLRWVGLAAAAPLVHAQRASRPNPVGYAMISFPDDQFNQALPVVANLHYQGIQIRSDVFKTYVSKAAALKERVDSLKLKPVVLSFPSVSLDPAKRDETTALFREYVSFHRQIGGTYLQLIDAGNPDATYSNDEIKSYGAYINELGKTAVDSGLTLSYHPHVASIGETREGMDRILGATDPRYLKFQPDVAHMTLGGMNPADAIRAYRDRLAFFHFKDAVREVAAQAKTNRPAIRKIKVRFCEIGRGAVDYPAILRAIDEVQFTGWIIVELDAYQQPPGGPAESARTNQLAMRKMGFNV